MDFSIYKNKNLGFTLMETLLTMFLIGALFSFFIPIAISFVKRNDLDMASEISANALFRAQSLAKLSSHNSSWGVYSLRDAALLLRKDPGPERDRNFYATNPK